MVFLHSHGVGTARAWIVVDPVSSYLGKTDSHRNSEVRGVLEPLSDMAERARIAILSVTHFSKAGAGNTTKALHRFIGSIAFTGAPRAAFAVIEDAEYDGRRLLLHAKNNLASPPQGLAFRLEQCLVFLPLPENPTRPCTCAASSSTPTPRQNSTR